MSASFSDELLDVRLPCRCDTTRRTGNVVVAAVREGEAAALQGVVQPSDTVCPSPFARPASPHTI